MPDALPVWNEENLCKVLSTLYTQAVHDQALHQKLMSNPYQVLSQHIQIPASYQTNFFAKPQGHPGVTLNVPPYQGEASAAAAPGGKLLQADYVIYCTTEPW